MSKRQVIMILGVFAAVFLFLGFPPSWDKPVELVCGLTIVWLAYRMAPPRIPPADAHRPYTEHKNEPTDSSRTITPHTPAP